VKHVASARDHSERREGASWRRRFGHRNDEDGVIESFFGAAAAQMYDPLGARFAEHALGNFEALDCTRRLVLF
jgi:hypothetical protein